jgi:hypothetical protein
MHGCRDYGITCCFYRLSPEARRTAETVDGTEGATYLEMTR